MHERGWLQGVSGPLTDQASCGNAPQFIVDERQELIHNGSITGSQITQNLRYVPVIAPLGPPHGIPVTDSVLRKRRIGPAPRAKGSKPDPKRAVETERKRRDQLQLISPTYLPENCALYSPWNCALSVDEPVTTTWPPMMRRESVASEYPEPLRGTI